MTTTLRDELEPVVDEARGIVEELGFRPYTVTVRTRVWEDGTPGRGDYEDTDLELEPAPKVGAPPRYLMGLPGRYEEGDLVVSRISRSYTVAELGGGTPTAGTEVVWVLDDGEEVQEYRLVGPPEKRPLEWRCQLRRLRRARTTST